MKREKTQCCGQRWCVGDPCGIICAVITWGLVLYGEVCVVSVMMWSWDEYALHQTANFLLFQFLAVMALSSHLKTMLTDPGAVPKGLLTEDTMERLAEMTTEVIIRCQKCCSMKPDRAHHCSVCERCIRRMDHHCPWVNNCVGEGNQKYFVLFTLYISLLSLHALYWGIWQFVLCVGEEWRGCSAFGPPGTTLMLIFLLFEAILFAIFTCVMFGTQVSSIFSDETAIESLKNQRARYRKGVEMGQKLMNSLTASDSTEQHARNDGWKNLQLVFGGPFSMRWLSPFSPPYRFHTGFEYSV